MENTAALTPTGVAAGATSATTIELSSTPAATQTALSTDTLTPEAVIEVEPSITLPPTETDKPTVTPTLSPTTAASATPTLSEFDVAGTLEVEIALIQTENGQTAEAALTATATYWTATPAPDLRATAEALLTHTQDAMNAQATRNTEAAATQAAVDHTATATLWTATPTATDTPSLTPTDTPTPTWTPTFTPEPTRTPPPTATPDPLQAALELAQNFNGGNTGWEPVVQTFNGVEMVLVPAGCFEMGGTQYDDEKPIHRVCFEEPFWIDRTEVTNGQFAAFNGQAASSSYFSGDDRPREQITWTEAQAFCESRGARLPTEAEWEYAARGPDAWEYPWGDTWDQDRVIGYRSSSEGTAPVGSIPDGVSWVGAVDMSGNVWEWVADWYDAGDYGTLADGVIDPTGPVSGEYRVLRGGSWIVNYPGDFRAAIRYWFNPVIRLNHLGFRCARSR